MKRAPYEARQITYKGRKIPVEIARGKALGNGWIEYSVHITEASFIDVFGSADFVLAVKPELPCTPEHDPEHDRRTPEQTILVKELWTCICEQKL